MLLTNLTVRIGGSGVVIANSRLSEYGSYSPRDLLELHFVITILSV
jgi:hypothetical protein